MAELATQEAKFGDTNNTLWLKIATALQGGITSPVPVNTLAPAIEGVSSLGNEVSCTTGNWTNDPTSYTYQWFLNDAPIGGATASTWVVAGTVEDEFYCEVTAHNATGASAPAQSNTDVIQDPLAGIAWAARLQTHEGDNVPIGLWQDIAKTTPATMDGDPIAVWEDVLSASGMEATQSDEQKQPMLVFVDGVPTIVFDGVDDLLNFTTLAGVDTSATFVVGNRDTVGAFAAFVAFTGEMGVYARGSTTGWSVYDTSERLAGVVIGATFTEVSIVRTGAATEMRTNGGSLASSGQAAGGIYTSSHIGGDQFGQMLPGSIIAVLNGPENVTLAVVDAYLETLKP